MDGAYPETAGSPWDFSQTVGGGGRSDVTVAQARVLVPWG